MKRKYLSYFIITFLIIIIVTFFNWAYKNYMINKLNINNESILNLKNKDVNFKIDLSKNMLFVEECAYERLKYISEEKKESMHKFLDSIKDEKVLFDPRSIDTLEIEIKESNIVYTSSHDYGKLDKKFTDFLVNRISNYILNNNIQNIEIYTLVPTKFNENFAPPGPGILTNF